MTVAVADKTEHIIKFPELRGANRALGACRDLEVLLDGPAGTGKTFAALLKIHTLLLRYPGAKALVARKSNTALSGSALATYREMIQPEEGIRYFGGNKVRPAAFEYPNGSMLVVNGLDRPSKVKSWEFSIVFINEATECTVEDIEFVRSRLRQGKLPYHQLILDCNPDAPTHWLNLRCNEGITTRLSSQHEDNPRFHDGNDWTEEGRKYIFETLGGLTGVRLSRFRYGIWAAATGTVYEDAWNRARNVIKPFAIPAEWPRYLSVDFGFTNPFVCKWYARDDDGRLYMYREIYHTKRLVEDHAKQIKHVARWGQDGGDPLPREIICDTDAEDRHTLERHLGLRTVAAHKSVSDGIQAVASRLRAAGDGKPRLMYFDNALVERDRELADRKKPTCTIEEFDSYVWDTKKEAPVKEDDHGCLVAGTMVLTDHGDVPIEQIRAGDYVLTRRGYKRVKAAGMTNHSAKVYTLRCSNGAKLTGTHDHPIYVYGQGYTPLLAMRYGDIMMTANKPHERLSLWEEIKASQKSLSTKALHSGAIPTQVNGPIGTILFQMPHIENVVLADFTRKYGKMLTGLFHQGITSTIKTKTLSITLLRTLNACQLQITTPIMSQLIQQKRLNSAESGLIGYAQQAQIGIAQKRVEHGIKSLGIWLGKTLNTLLASVQTVGMNFNILRWAMQRFIALMSVNPHPVVNQALTMSNASAPVVERRLLSTNIAPLGAVPVYALSIYEEADFQPVYNLTVENAVGEGEYFANGILVHNCDADRYMVARFDLKPMSVFYSKRVY